LELDKIILFGSRARGDFTKYSDWYFLIVVKNSIDISEKKEAGKSH
jgi:predicted nucleotidyltransferase